MRWRRRWRSACSAWSQASNGSPQVPAVLVAVVVSILVANAFNLADHGVSLVGPLPQGFPPFTLPSLQGSDMALLVAGAVGIAVVSLTDTISTSSAFAARSGQEVDGDREMIGIGAANIAAGFFRGSRSAPAAHAPRWPSRPGPRPRSPGWSGRWRSPSCCWWPGLLRNLPQPTLAAVVIVASLSLADIPGTVRLWRQRRTEFTLSMAAFAGVALLGVLPGIAIAVALSIGNVFRRRGGPTRRCSDGSRASPATTMCAATPMPNSCRDVCCSVRRAAVLRQRPDLPRAGPQAGQSNPARCGSWWPPSPSPTSTPRPPTCSRTSTRPSTPRASAWSSRAEGPGPREDRAVRADPRHRARAFLPHRWRGRGRVPRAVRGRLGLPPPASRSR